MENKPNICDTCDRPFTEEPNIAGTNSEELREECNNCYNNITINDGSVITKQPMDKEFVPYEQALALKELGYDEPCLGFYKNNDIHYSSTIGIEEDFHLWKVKLSNDSVLAPLYQQAFKFFREKYGLIGQPIPLSISYPGKVTHYGWSIVSNQKTNDWENDDDGFKTYEEAESACLNELIQIVKNKTNENSNRMVN